jgi:uncharacterized protein DUF6259
MKTNGKSSPLGLVLVPLFWCLVSWGGAQTPFIIESRTETGEVTDGTLYEEAGGWFAAGSTAKSRAGAPELPGGVLQGAGSRFSFADNLDASYVMKIGAHPSFVPGAEYDLLITVPDAPTIDATNSTFVIYDNAHPENAPLASGVVPLTHLDCGDVWYPLAAKLELGVGAAVLISEATPQSDRFYADAIRAQPVLGDADLGVGRRAILDDATRWEPWPSGLTDPSLNATVIESEEGIVFTLPEANKEMSWRCSMRPAWMKTHHYLTFRYRLSGELEGSGGPVMRLCSSADSWFTAVVPSDLRIDGKVRTLTVDLSAKTSQEQVVGVDIHLASDASEGVTLEVLGLEFRDHPENFQFAPAQPDSDVAVGYSLDLVAPDDFTAMPEWLSGASVSTDYSVATQEGSLVFSINEAYKGMKWRNITLGTQNTVSFPYILLKYRAEHLRDSTAGYTIYLNNGSEESRPIYQVDLIDNGVWQWALVPVGIELVSSMAVQVQADGSGGAWLEIGKLAFVDGDPRSDMTYFSAVSEGWGNIAGSVDDFAFVDLESKFNSAADQLLPRMGIQAAWYETPQVLADGQIPFLLGEERVNIVATDIPATQPLEVPIGLAASELYFLLGAYYPARENAFNETTINIVDETERFSVEVVYTDGEADEYFPIDFTSGFHQILNNRFVPLAVPADASRTIELVRFNEKSDGGLIGLAALSVKTSGDAIYAEHFNVPAPTALNLPLEPTPLAPAMRYNEPTLVLENTFARYEFDLSDGFEFTSWISAYTGHDLLETASDGRFFSGQLDGDLFTSLDFVTGDVVVVENEGISTVTIPLSLKSSADSIQGALTISIDGSHQARFALEMENAGTTDHAFSLVFPDLSGLTLGGESEGLAYAYPRKPFLLGTIPTNLSTLYSGYFSMQFMDLYDASEGWGVSLVVHDTELLWKEFGLRKGDGDAALWVSYPTVESVGLAAGTSMEVAPFSLGIHGGDWHWAMNAYMDWVKTWYTPSSPRQRWFQDIYTCRRDYPISGTWRLFDRPENTYTFPKLIDNANRYLGGADMIDISSWGWSSTGGRVGDYRLYELGGLDNFHTGIEQSQDQDIPVGLYIEGYLIDERSTVYQEHGQEWEMIKSDGSVDHQGSEVTMCPYPDDWQDHMRALYADVAEETNAAAMYIDVYGMGHRACYSPDHGHAVGELVLRGEAEMTRTIREGLNEVREGIPLYTEFTPVDVISQYQDGSFSNTIWTAGSSSVTKTNLFRFCFPDFKQIEIVNGLFLARNWTEEGLKKAFFNGEGIWVKGDISAWYDENTVDFYIKSHEIYGDHRDAFASIHPDPLVETLTGNVYANRFDTDRKKLVMFYNDNWRDVFGEVQIAEDVTGYHVVDLWREEMLGAATDSVNYLVKAHLAPRDIGCVVLTPRLFDVQVVNSGLLLRLVSPEPGDVLTVTAVNGGRRESKSLIVQGNPVVLNPDTLFEQRPVKLIIKLERDNVVADLIVVEAADISDGLQTTDWVWR